MNCRIARHTSNLKKIEEFYTKIIGLEKLGSFEKHDNYDGIFLGHRNSNWHLEFTSSLKHSKSKFDDDDILVFYVNSQLEIENIKKLLTQENIKLEIPKNPYWVKNGIMISDPDDYKIIFSIKHLTFNSQDDLTSLVKGQGIENWSDLIDFTRKLPYGRNLKRKDFSLVIKEKIGTCSSKHAFLKKIADLNNFADIKLILGVYKMNNFNTPKIGNTIIDVGLTYIPEAHCYLKINERRIDITNFNSDFEVYKLDILEEFEIAPEQVNKFKITYHKLYLKNWIDQESVKLNLKELWEIREKCISKLSNSN